MIMNSIILVLFVIPSFLVLSVAVVVPTKEIYGVNLGGWLVIEHFITPSLFTNKNIWDEYTYHKYARNTSNTKLYRDLVNHWETFYTEDDIKSIAEVGFTHVRVPVPYWMVMTDEEVQFYKEPYFTGQFTYLKRLISWLKKYKVKCLIDLHAAPGSQNPWEHSGRKGNVQWGTGDTINRTLLYIGRIAQKIADLENDESTSDVVYGLEVLNEALPSMISGGLFTVKNYYLRAYDVVRTYLPAEKYAFVIEEAFSSGGGAWKNFMPAPKYQNVILDMHVYHCFDPYMRTQSYNFHLNLACVINSRNFVQTLPTFCGEWSVGWKNESGIAWREKYPTPTERAFMKQLGLAEMNTYLRSNGFFFWTWKTESAPMWDYKLGINGGWLPNRFPTPLTNSGCDVLTFQNDTNPFPTLSPESTIRNSTITSSGQSSTTITTTITPSTQNTSSYISSTTSTIDTPTTSSSRTTSSTADASSTTISSTAEETSDSSEESSTFISPSTTSVASSELTTTSIPEEQGTAASMIDRSFCVSAAIIMLLALLFNLL